MLDDMLALAHSVFLLCGCRTVVGTYASLLGVADRAVLCCAVLCCAVLCCGIARQHATLEQLGVLL